MENKPDAFSATEQKIINAALKTFIRFGEKKTTMADVAAEAGVVRQTVYAAFKSKDKLVAQCINYLSYSNLTAIRTQMSDCTTIAEKFDVYINNTVVAGFNLMGKAINPAKIISPTNIIGQDALDASLRDKVMLVIEMFEPYTKALAHHKQTPETVANLLVITGMAIEASAKNRDMLDQLINTLKSSIICLTTH